MKKLCLLIISFCLLIFLFLYFRFEGKIDYRNSNIPKIYRYTEKDQVIPEEFLITKFEQQSGYVLFGEEYNNTYFYEKDGKIYCQNSHSHPEEIIYYMHQSGGQGIFGYSGGDAERKAFICDSQYFIDEYRSFSGRNIYGPFEL